VGRLELKREPFGRSRNKDIALNSDKGFAQRRNRSGEEPPVPPSLLNGILIPLRLDPSQNPLEEVRKSLRHSSCGRG